QRPARKPLKQPKIPMQFAYLHPTDRAPEDATIEKNPNAPILSDKNRRARQEVPTPPGIRPLSIDPHSKGDTIERVRPDPSLKEGRDSLEPPKPASAAATVPEKEGEAEKTATAGRNGQSSSAAGASSDQAGVRASGAEGAAAAGSEAGIPRGAAAVSD